MTPYVEAEYEDGYVHREDEQDHSPYVQFKNIFDDILHKRPEPIHGKMVRFSLVLSEERHDVDWVGLPENARPVRFKHMEASFTPGGEVADKRIVGIDFGYQYTDGDGNHQEIISV